MKIIYNPSQCTDMCHKYTLTRATSMPATIRQQQGAALIVVMMVVLLLAIAGTIAVRSSQTSLNMTTAAQVNQLLMQSSDVPLAQLETAQKTKFTNGGTETQLAAMVDDNGPIGYLRKNGTSKDFDGAEYVLCYQPTERRGLYGGKNSHLVLSVDADGTAKRRKAGLSDKGYCKLSDEDSYTSARGVVATQVAMTRPTLDDDLFEGTNVTTNATTNAKERTHTNRAFEAQAQGSDAETFAGGKNVKIRTYVTSVLPVLAVTSTPSQIEACLKLPMGGLSNSTTNLDNQRSCLNRTDTPYNIQVQDYMYIEQPQAAPAPVIP